MLIRRVVRRLRGAVRRKEKLCPFGELKPIAHTLVGAYCFMPSKRVIAIMKVASVLPRRNTFAIPNHCARPSDPETGGG